MSRRFRRFRLFSSWNIAISVLLTLPHLAHADWFDVLEGAVLRELALVALDKQGMEATLDFQELAGATRVLPEIRAALVVVRTDQGRIARVLIEPAFRSPVDDRADLVPIVILERFATFDAPACLERSASGGDVQLFDGFTFDLDSGQVVPQGFGGDLVVQTSLQPGSKEKTSLIAGPGVSLTLITKSIEISTLVGDNRPSHDRVIAASDFGGRFSLQTDGRSFGLLSLRVVSNGPVMGTYRSKERGRLHNVVGRIIGDHSGHIKFSIQFPQAVRDYEGYLWSEGKAIIAGHTTMLGHTSSFVAIRLDPDRADADLFKMTSPTGSELDHPEDPPTDPEYDSGV